MQFTLPRSALPDDKLHRRDLLDRYFPFDLIPFEELIDNHWRITSFPRDIRTYFADPKIERELKGWFEEIPLEEIGSYYRFFKNTMISFNDSWSLYYWALVVQWLRSNHVEVDKISLLHVDDHSDLGSPLLELTEKNYRCIFTKREVDFKDPESIKEAILKKSIDIGSFICPLLQEVGEVEILHLKHSFSGSLKRRKLGCTEDLDTLLAKNSPRPALKLDQPNGKHSYSLSSNLDDLIDRSNLSSLLFLHIDCDAFNNRYNGDSSWNHRPSSIDLNLAQIKGKITQLLECVKNLPVKVFMNVALSPDFFPSEYWREATSHLFKTAELLGVVQDDDFSHFLKAHFPDEQMNEKFS